MYMKRMIRKAAILSLGMTAVFALASCECDCEIKGGGDTEVVTVNGKNSLSGVILDQDGAVLTGVTITVNGKNVPTNGNLFEMTDLDDGTYEVVIKKDGYKDYVTTVTLTSTSQTVEGKTVKAGQDEKLTFYLTKEVEALFQLGGTAQEKEIVLETSRQDDGTGTIVSNTQDPSNDALYSEVTASCEIPGLTADQLANVGEQLAAQGLNLSQFTFALTNISSLSEAEGASAARATRAIVTPGDVLPGNYTMFTGLQIGDPATVDFTSFPNYAVTLTFDLPDNNVKGAIKLFRYVNSQAAAGWTEVTSTTAGTGISSIDFSQDKKIVVRLNVLEPQAFVLGIQVDRTFNNTTSGEIVYTPVTNNGTSAMVVRSMNYQARSGLVLQNNTQGPLTDYLRKMVLRFYQMTAVKEPVLESHTYRVVPPYSLPASGALHLSASQQVSDETFSVMNGTSSFTAQRFGSVYVVHYAVIPPGSEVVPTHNGGSND
jgi:hypothetical protein